MTFHGRGKELRSNRFKHVVLCSIAFVLSTGYTAAVLISKSSKSDTVMSQSSKFSPPLLSQWSSMPDINGTRRRAGSRAST